MRSEKPLVVIPAFNEEASVADVVKAVKACPTACDVLVVSDGSKDSTVLQARKAGAKVVELPINCGVGGAMRTGYRWAVSHGYWTVLQVDADGQHDPKDIPALLTALENADIVIGARFAGKGNYTVRGPRKWAMGLLSLVLKLITGKKFTDTTSGFRATGPKGTAFFASNYSFEYLGDTVENLVMAARSGLKITQVAVEMLPRQAGEPSQSPLKMVTKLLRLFLAIFLSLIRRPEVISPKYQYRQAEEA